MRKQLILSTVLLLAGAALTTTGSAAITQSSSALTPRTVPITPGTLNGLQTVTFTIKQDYLYKRDLNVIAYRLDDFLRANVNNIDELARQGYVVTFLCADGYAPKAKLADLLGQGGLIAVADADAGEARWQPAPYKDKVLTAEEVGNYLVWENATFPAKPAPWGLVRIDINPTP